MILKLNFKFIVSFLALTFVMHEAHEIVHTSIGRMICGCWGKRDFNVWETCESCAKNPLEILSTLAGPVFTFIMIWVGYNLINKGGNKTALGFSLIFANMPFARLLNPTLGGGDEVVVVNSIIHNHDTSRIIVFILILLIVAIPLYKAYKIIQNKRKLGWFLLFFIVPTFFDLLIVLGVMNTLLEKGILSQYWILGSPLIVTVWTLFVTGIFIITRKFIYKLRA